MTVEEFRSLWFDEWGFDESGSPEDAGDYLEGVLSVIRDDGDYIAFIGAIEGQQQFISQWLISKNLAYRTEKRRTLALTGDGTRLLAALEASLHYDLFL